MSLWCIARSPLIFGGDLIRGAQMPEVLDLLTNPEVRGQRGQRTRLVVTGGRCIPNRPIMAEDPPGGIEGASASQIARLCSTCNCVRP